MLLDDGNRIIIPQGNFKVFCEFGAIIFFFWREGRFDLVKVMKNNEFYSHGLNIIMGMVPVISYKDVISIVLEYTV